MAVVSMDAINFYEPPPRAGLRGDKRPPVSNGNVSILGEWCEGRQAFGPSQRPNGRLQDYDLIEVLDMTTPPPNEPFDPFDPFGKLGAEVKATGADAGDMTNHRCRSRGHGRMGSEESQDLPSLKELLRSGKEMQEPHRAGGNGIYLTAKSDEGLGHAAENDRKESDSPKSGWGKSKEPMLWNDERLEICDNQDAEDSDTQNTRREHADIQETEREAGSGGIVHTGDGSPSEEQDREQGGELNKRARWDGKAAEADDAGGGLQGDNNEQSTLLRPTKKRCQSVGEKKLPVKRRVKRRRFSSPLSSDEETETGTEPDISSYPPAKLYRISNLRSSSSPLPVGRERAPKPDDALEGANGKSKRRPLSRTAVVYKQQCWEGEILQERDVKQERGRPRKQYLVRWEQSWVDGTSLTAPELLRDWREKKVSSKRKC
ncbi:MAG: hypothetical protein Q9201_007534 [Fulgogasparrea decipioides]